MVNLLVDARGRKKGVVLSLREYQALLRRLEDLEDALELQHAREQGDEFESLESVIRRLGPKRR